MSDVPSFPYRLLWEERQLFSVANLTRRDGLDFLGLAPSMGIDVKTTLFRSSKPTRRLRIFVRGVSKALPFWSPDVLAGRRWVTPSVEGQAAASIEATRTSFLFTNSWMPIPDNSRP